jgi:hypothetical protein
MLEQYYTTLYLATTIQIQQGGQCYTKYAAGKSFSGLLERQSSTFRSVASKQDVEESYVLFTTPDNVFELGTVIAKRLPNGTLLFAMVESAPLYPVNQSRIKQVQYKLRHFIPPYAHGVADMEDM